MIIIKGTSLNKSKLWKSLAEKNYPLYKKKKQKLQKCRLCFISPNFPSADEAFPTVLRSSPDLLMLMMMMIVLWYWCCWCLVLSIFLCHALPKFHTYRIQLVLFRISAFWPVHNCAWASCWANLNVFLQINLEFSATGKKLWAKPYFRIPALTIALDVSMKGYHGIKSSRRQFLKLHLLFPTFASY